MGEASFCLLTPCHGTSPLPISSSVPHAGPPLPRPLPKVSLMLMCKKFLEMLPFLFRSNLSTGGSPVAKQFRMPWLIFHLSPQADCPGTSRLPSPPRAGGGVLLGPDAEAPGAERCAERPPDARVRQQFPRPLPLSRPHVPGHCHQNLPHPPASTLFSGSRSRCHPPLAPFWPITTG